MTQLSKVKQNIQLGAETMWTVHGICE